MNIATFATTENGSSKTTRVIFEHYSVICIRVNDINCIYMGNLTTFS